jgi:hypothetical protein
VRLRAAADPRIDPVAPVAEPGLQNVFVPQRSASRFRQNTTATHSDTSTRTCGYARARVIKDKTFQAIGMFERVRTADRTLLTPERPDGLSPRRGTRERSCGSLLPVWFEVRKH